MPGWFGEDGGNPGQRVVERRDARAGFPELLLDGSDNKGNLGANAILGVSLATAKAAAAALELPLYRYLGGVSGRMLPVPMMNIINGGAHAANNLDIQEFMIIPFGAKSIAQAVQMGAETFHKLKSILKGRKLSTAVGDEGGFAPDLKSNAEALDFIMKAIKAAGYTPGKDMGLALDVAASELYAKKKYMLKGENKSLSAVEMVDYFEGLVEKYPIVSIEDGLAEQDWENWVVMTDRLDEYIQIVVDDVFVTNPGIFAKGIEDGLANSILIKLNQIGTVTETLDAIEMAGQAGENPIADRAAAGARHGGIGGIRRSLPLPPRQPRFSTGRGLCGGSPDASAARQPCRAALRHAHAAAARRYALHRWEPREPGRRTPRQRRFWQPCPANPHPPRTHHSGASTGVIPICILLIPRTPS